MNTQKLLALSCLVIATTAVAQLSQTTLSRQGHDGGGGKSSAGDIVLQGTIGQPDAGVATNGDLNLRGGIWRAEAAGLQPSGDFTGDGVWNCIDSAALASEIVAETNSLAFDMNGDSLVDLADMYGPGGWLEVAALQNLAGGSYPPGDADLDGAVAGGDLTVWNSNRFAFLSGPCAGDFDINGVVDGYDYLVWLENRFQ